MKASVFITATALAVTALAHGGIDKYITGDKVYEGWEPYNDPAGQKSIQRQYSSYDPLFIKDLTTVNIRCNNKGALGTGVTGTIAAGAKLTTHWKQWTHRPATFMVYMAKCPGSCDSWDGSGKVWFKIFEQGLISGTENAGIWAGDAIFETLNATITVPNVLAGEYMFRHELTALHQANNPQFYPECAQFTVTGSGTASPPASYLVSFPGAYTGTEPGLAFNIDSEDAKKATKYPLPGPQLWDGTDSGNATTPGSATPSTAATKQRGADTSGRLRRHGKC